MITGKMRIKLICLFAALFAAAGVALLFAPGVRAEQAGAEIALTDGAYIRADSEENSGLKFQAEADRVYYEGLLSQYGESLSAGMAIVPADYIETAGGYTLDKLEALGEISRAESGNVKYEEEKCTWHVTINKIMDHNYTREFAAVAYLKITGEEGTVAEEGFSYYNGAYYRYADYVAENNSRTVYGVAYSALEDDSLLPEQYEIVKGFADSVAVISAEGGTATIGNNKEGYTSPYTLLKTENGYAVYSEDGKTAPRSVLYNGESRRPVFEADGEIYAPVLSSGAVLSGDGAELSAGTFVPSVATKSHIAQTDSSYVAFEGDYGAGYYAEFEFTGNNLPQVMFFANEINGNMTSQTPNAQGNVPNGNKGLIITNGLVLSSGSTSGINALRIWGPDRISRHYDGSGENYGGEWIASLTDYPEFTQGGLIEDRHYKYVAGTYLEGQNITLDLKLYYYQGEILVGLYDVQIPTGLTEEDLSGTNIVAYAGMKGSGNGTAFTYSLPVQGYEPPQNVITASGATFDNGTVTLAGKALPNNVNIGHIAMIDNSYIAFKGDYGVGYYTEFEFTGNNLPNVMLFANDITGNMTNGDFATATSITPNGSKGILLNNGFTVDAPGTSNGRYNLFTITKMDKIDRLFDTMTGDNCILSASNVNGLALMSQSGLSSEQNAQTRFRYTVGTYLNEEGYIVIDISLQRENEGVWTDAFAAGTNTDIVTPYKEADIEGTNIVCYASVKGTGNDTVFSFSAPELRQTQAEQIKAG